MKQIRVLIAEDHAIVREGIRLLLEAQPDMMVVGEAADGEGAIAQVPTTSPDVVIMDLSMPGMGGLEAARLLKKQYPQVQIVALTVHESDQYLFRALAAGATGYVLKGASSQELVAAVRAAHRGEAFLHPTMAKKLVGDYLRRVRSGEETDSYEVLTARERQVLRLLAEGHTNQEIADILVITPSTVQTHRLHIMEKLQFQNRSDLVKYAIRVGLIGLND